MPSLQRTRSEMLIDAVWRTVFRVGFRVIRVWWYFRRPQHEGALVAIYVGRALLLVKSSYRAAWNFPGGSVRPGETPEAAAQREVAEEIGLPSCTLVPAGTASGVWDWRRDRVHFFELHLDRLPDLRLDHREIIGAQLVEPDELPGYALTEAVAAYVGGKLGS